MSHFDDLPQRSQSHHIEEKAVAAFQARLAESDAFIFQGADRKDYGTDCQIEVIDNGQATNVRIHVQLKSTERPLNADGSLSVEVHRTNLNYLLMQEYSFYACYHVPTCSLRICSVESVLRQYEHSGKNWLAQDSLTVSLVDKLTTEYLIQLAALARSTARSSRDWRVGQFSARSPTALRRSLRSVPDIYVPESSEQAAYVLAHLYEQRADDVISLAFDRFMAVLGNQSDAIGRVYMAEINLGMTGLSQHTQRIKDGINYFRSKLDSDNYRIGSLHYTIGNAFTALGDAESAKLSYETALADPTLEDALELAASCHKNLGASLEQLGNQDRAIDHYREALRLSPNLAEAHNALGNYYAHIGSYEDALAHFDRVVFAERTPYKILAVIGWRANVLFNLQDSRGAFREVNSLLSHADSFDWIWPWCARLVASFCRTTTESAGLARPFWQRYVNAYPDQSAARRELLLTILYLRAAGKDVGISYAEFCNEFSRHISHIDAHDAALPWDRLGHWAQNEGDWKQAEHCFRKAYDLEGGIYGYCLGIALNALGRYEESLPIFLEQAQTHQPDAMSWFQVASTYVNLKRNSEAIDAYKRTLALDPNYAPAMFDLGGTYWNTGEFEQASQVWKIAVTRFPEHDLAKEVKRNFIILL